MDKLNGCAIDSTLMCRQYDVDVLLVCLPRLFGWLLVWMVTCVAVRYAMSVMS